MEGPSRPPWWSFVLVTALVAPFCFLGLSETDSDTFYHLAAGRWMHEHHRVLDHETFSFTIPGRPWTNYYWAFERLLFGAYRLAGFAGPIALRGLIVLLTVNLFLLLVHRRTRGAPLETIAFGLMVMPVYVLRAVNVRPHLFSYLFLVIALLLADAFGRRRRGAGMALAALCVLWANLHGVEYPVLLAVLLIHFLDALRPHLRGQMGETLRDPDVRRWALLVAACALAFLVNPFGWRVFLTPRIGADAEVMAQISEMAAPSLASFGQLSPALDLASWVPLRLTALVGLALLPWMIRTGQLRNAALFALGLALLLNKARFAVEFILLAVPSVAAAVATARRRSTRTWPRYALVAAAVYVAASAAVTLRDKARAGAFAPVSAAVFPVGAVRFIEQSGLSGNLHGEPTFAGYVTFLLYPRVRVSMDMRAPEPFGAQELWLAWTLGDAIPIERVEERWPIDLVLFRHVHRLAARFRAQPGFAPVYADSDWILLARVRDGAIAAGVPPLTTLPFLEALAAGREVPPPPPLTVLRAEAERLAGAWPANDLAQRGLLWLLLQEGRTAEAHTRAEALARQFPRRATYPFFSGLALRQLGRPAEAADAFRRAASLAPAFLPAHTALAEALLAAQRPEEARDVMEKATWSRWAVLSAREYALLGRTRQQTARWRPARDAFERALWLLSPDDPIRPDVDNDLAVVSLAEGDPARALAALDDALARRPAFPQAQLNRARALRSLGRQAESRAILDRLAVDPELPAPLRAAVMAERGR